MCLFFVDAEVSEPVEDGGSLPCVPVDVRGHSLGQHAREIAEDATARDVRERLDVRLHAQRAHVVEIQTVWREHHVGVEVFVPDQRPDEGVAVCMQTARRKANDCVASCAAGTVDHVVAVDDTDARAGEVELVVPVDAG